MFRLFPLPAVLSLSLLLLPVAALSADGPRLVAEEADISFGSVVQGEKVETVFAFTNAGDETLQIERVKSSCGCTAALLSSRDLAPGESGEVRATFDSTRFQGQVVKTIYLYTNDPLHKVVQLHLRGEVKRQVTVSPNRLTFDGLVPGQAASASLQVANVGEDDIRLEQVEATAAEVSVDVAPGPLKPGETTEVKVRVTLPEGKDGLNAYLLVRFSGTAIAEQRVSLTARPAR